MILAIPKEVTADEKRVAISPSNISAFKKLGYEIHFEAGAGDTASMPDELYRSEGARIVVGSEKIWIGADLILKVNPPTLEEAEMIAEGVTLICFVYPARNEELIKILSAKKINLLAMDCVPRISRAQSMDALSSMANVAGYRAVVEASHCFGRFFTGQITAAGKVPPAKVLVIGAGVAGLAAIGAARNMGAIVRAFDTRPAVKDEVKSLGGEFLMLDFEEDGAGSGGYAKAMREGFIASELKVFESSHSNEVSNDWSSFSNFARVPEDTVTLRFSQDQLNYVVENIEWDLISADRRGLINNFLASFAKAESYDGGRVNMSYNLALQGVQTIISRAVK